MSKVFTAQYILLLTEQTEYYRIPNRISLLYDLSHNALSVLCYKITLEKHTYLTCRQGTYIRYKQYVLKLLIRTDIKKPSSMQCRQNELSRVYRRRGSH